MNARTTASIATIILFVLVATCFPGCGSHAMAPDVSLVSITGKKVRMRDLAGAPVLVTFWATDCPTCIRELPELIRLHRDFAHRGLRLIAISMFYDMPSRVVSLARARTLPYTVALDPQGRLARAFGNVEVTPTSILIAPDGSVRSRITGPLDFTELRSNIERMLQQENS